MHGVHSALSQHIRRMHHSTMNFAQMATNWVMYRHTAGAWPIR